MSHSIHTFTSIVHYTSQHTLLSYWHHDIQKVIHSFFSKQTWLVRAIHTKNQLFHAVANAVQKISVIKYYLSFFTSHLCLYLRGEVSFFFTS